MVAYATTYARDPATGQILFDASGNAQFLSGLTPSSSGPNFPPVDFVRDDPGTGQVLFDANGYPLIVQPGWFILGSATSGILGVNWLGPPP